MLEFKDKKIVVLGLAKSGTTIAKILHSLGARVLVNDAKPDEKCLEKDELESLGIKVICGGHPEDLVDESVDMLIKNPGIPYSVLPIKIAEELSIPIVTEIELAYYFSKVPIIGITGSNGKTTTTTLIGEIIKQAGKAPIVAGNIGTVLSEKALKATEDEVLVAELSSFQLKGTLRFKPNIAILVNIYPAHLDYHHGIEDYITSKAKIFKNQDDKDYAVLNADCSESMRLVPDIKSNIYYFSTSKPVDKGAYIDKGIIYWKDKGLEELISTKELFLKGAHLENVLAAIIATKLYGINTEVILETLRSFKGVEHRVEYVLATKNGVTFYNDSKATNPQATISALKSFDKPIILLAGGLDRGIEFEELIEPFTNHIKVLITFGQTADKLKKIANLAGIYQVVTVDNINAAVKKSFSIANDNDVVLLSPACASWDMFSSFEERGRIFKEAVHRLI